MKTPFGLSVVATAAMLCGVTPALADCGFTGTDVAIDMNPGSAAMDPYATDPVTHALGIPIDRDCDVVFFEFGDAAVLRSGTDTIPFTVGVRNGKKVSGPRGRDRWRIGRRQTAIELFLTMDTDAGGIPRSGNYTHSTTLRLYDGRKSTTPIGDGTRTSGSIPARISARIDEVMTISLNRVRADYVLDLGPLTPGEQATGKVTLRAVSNDPYTITFRSAKDWNIVHEAAEGDYEIPYTLDFAGRRIGADTTVDDLEATGEEGTERQLSVTASPPSAQTRNLRAGAYRDEVTIIITGTAADR